MAKKTKTDDADGGKQQVIKMVPKATLTSWLSAKAKAAESVKDITHSIGEHTREAQKKGLDKNVGNLIFKLRSFTPEKLALWKTHFDDQWIKSGLEARAESAPAFGFGEEREPEEDDDEEGDPKPARSGRAKGRAASEDEEDADGAFPHGQTH